MERKKIVITGMGAVTPIGVGVERYWDSLVQGVSGIDTIQKLDVEALPIKVAGEVKDFRAKDYMSPKLPGLGDVDWGAYCSALTDIGYDGAACIEVEDRAYEGCIEDVKSGIEQSYRYMRQFL